MASVLGVCWKSGTTGTIGQGVVSFAVVDMKAWWRAHDGTGAVVLKIPKAWRHKA